MSSRGYRDTKTRKPSAHRVRDKERTKIVSQIHAENYGVYGVRKMWHVRKRRGIFIGREQTQPDHGSCQG
ncbi:hypothetical protein [Arcanobacterium buesumense]|uniref:hypothetical protein n=1 Tax=Arcanobacterium buesumense TaxID=2722751 RepID=UPI001B3A9C0E|nr:hypothetical protein [Arcanobacterium buesumense]